MKALVTGGAGFIGSNLVDALVGRGDEVVVVDDLSSGKIENLEAAIDGGARFVEASIADAALLGELFAEARPEVVFHLAAQIDVRRSVSDPVYDLGVNVGGTLNLLAAARDSGAERFVFTSTGGAIYGEGEGRELPLDENADRRPDAPYGQSKYAAEGYCGLWSRLYGLSTASLRLGNVYGPRQDPHGEAGVVAIFCRSLIGGDTPRVFGDGEQTRDYIYVGDVVSAFIAAARSRAGGAFNIGTGVETNVLDLGAAIGEALGRPFEPKLEPARAGEVQRISIDARRAGSELAWRAEVSLAEGVERTAESFRAALGG
ncbi:NAD-dependent epimerase/dehydratase family protein [Thermoleophilia bacterium SCSIO 60948]|nr:NAD-dependent epimerase/dehydratase family protein [Thermoleophilia bacterium SCSIO 60948]